MATKSLDIRWLKRYRVFFIAGGFILVFQIFLAYVFIIISDANDKITYEYLSGRGNVNLDDIYSKEVNKKLQNVSLRRYNKNIHSEYDDANLISMSSRSKLPPDKVLIHIEDLDFVPSCDINNKQALSSIQRAKTQQCKQLISNITCQIVKNELYPTELPHTCPSDFIVGKSLGCYEDDSSSRLLSGYSVILKNNNSPQNCISICLQNGYLYAGVQFGSECFCGNEQVSSTYRRPDSSCNMKCSGDGKQACGGYYKINIYQTGLSKFQPQSAQEDEIKSSPSRPTVRIAFLLTLNGRALRQVHRLVRSLFHRDHFFLIHVDARQDYLFRELLELELKLPNVRLSRRRQSTIWGGASLLLMLLDSMQQLLDTGWQWDFIINLSESDYPVKANKKLVEFLTANKDKNFVKSHGREVQRFINKQGLDKSFVECEARMWRIGDRLLPKGIVMDGGSDWLVLSRSFVSYVASQDTDELVKGLLVLFRHTLLPAESFFHTVLRNSHLCDTYIDNNLHITNWKRKLGCKCQYKHVVDWCGCSPNNFKSEDYSRLVATQNKQLYFARKFEPIVNQDIINQLDQWLYGSYPLNMSSLNSYWENTYHYSDLSPQPDDALITIGTSLARINVKNKLKSCHFNYHQKRSKNNAIKQYSKNKTRTKIVNKIIADEIGTKNINNSLRNKRYVQNINNNNKTDFKDWNNIKNSVNTNKLIISYNERIIESFKRKIKNFDDFNEIKLKTDKKIDNFREMYETSNENLVPVQDAKNDDTNRKSNDNLNLSSPARGPKFNNYVEQIFVYKSYDVYKGTIIQYKIQFDQNETNNYLLPVQTFVKPKNIFRKIKFGEIVNKIKYLEISSNYDQKEQMTRDMFHSIGPYSEPVLIHEWLSDVTYNITYLWIDPTNLLASVTSVQIDENTTIDFVKPTLKNPLLPGEWKIKLIWNDEVYIETGFLVTPLEVLNKTPLSHQQVGFVHGGAYQYESYDKVWNKFLDLKSTQTLERKAILNSQRTGFDLRQWIDNLIARWYTIHDTCVVESAVPLQCGTTTLAPCRRTYWSSYYPDPKTEIVSINGSSGYLNRW